MKKFYLAALAVAGLSLVGCSSATTFTTVTHSLEYMESSARVLEADHNMLLTPVIADLDVSPTKIVYTEKELFANLDVTEELIMNVAELKKLAISRAARAHSADVLVGSTIDIVTNRGRLEVTVSGYPAKYVKFRNAKENEVQLLRQVNNIETVDGTAVLATPESTLNIKRTDRVSR